MPSTTKRRRTAPRATAGFPSQLREIIALRGLSPQKVADAAGINPTIVLRFLSRERGLTLETFDAIAGGLGLKLVETAKGRRPAKATAIVPDGIVEVIPAPDAEDCQPAPAPVVEAASNLGPMTESPAELATTSEMLGNARNPEPPVDPATASGLLLNVILDSAPVDPAKPNIEAATGEPENRSKLVTDLSAAEPDLLGNVGAGDLSTLVNAGTPGAPPNPVLSLFGAGRRV